MLSWAIFAGATAFVFSWWFLHHHDVSPSTFVCFHFSLAYDESLPVSPPRKHLDREDDPTPLRQDITIELLLRWRFLRRQIRDWEPKLVSLNRSLDNPTWYLIFTHEWTLVSIFLKNLNIKTRTLIYTPTQCRLVCVVRILSLVASFLWILERVSRTFAVRSSFLCIVCRAESATLNHNDLYTAYAEGNLAIHGCIRDESQDAYLFSV